MDLAILIYISKTIISCSSIVQSFLLRGWMVGLEERPYHCDVDDDVVVVDDDHGWRNSPLEKELPFNTKTSLFGEVCRLL